MELPHNLVDDEFIETQNLENIIAHVDNNNQNFDNSILYNKETLTKEYIINFLMNNGILQNKFICPICSKNMILSNNNSYADGKIWRCRGGIPLHDIKTNIRTNSIFENINIQIQILYFITFFCFIENLSLEKAFIETNNNKEILGNNTVTINGISKIYRLLREKLRKELHRKWNTDPIGIVIGPKGYACVEIDESEMIGNSQKIFWIFGIIDRTTKEARLFSVLNNRTKECLLPLLNNNVAINGEANLNLNMENEQYLINTRVYSDMFASYQLNDFAQLGYILRRVNHSVWFGYGQFHTNTIEGLWSHIKRLTKNFSGLTITKIDNMFDNDKKKYLDGWLCYGLLLREFEKKNIVN